MVQELELVLEQQQVGTQLLTALSNLLHDTIPCIDEIYAVHSVTAALMPTPICMQHYMSGVHLSLHNERPHTCC